MYISKVMQAQGVQFMSNRCASSLCKASLARGLTADREEALSVHAILPGYSLQLGTIRFDSFCSARHFAPVWVYIFRCAFLWHLACNLQQVAH